MAITRILLFSLYLLIIVFATTALASVKGPFWPALTVLALTAPISLFVAYMATIRRIHRLGLWSPDSLVVRFFSGVWVRFLWTIVAFLVAAAILSFRISTSGSLDLALMLAGVALLLVLSLLVRDRLSGQWAGVQRHGWPLWLLALFSAGVMSLLDPAIRALVGQYEGYLSAEEAINQVRAQGSNLGDSRVSFFLFDLGSYWSGWERFLMFRAMDTPTWFSWVIALLVAASRFPLYLAISFGATAILLPAHEFKRIFLKIKDQEMPASLTKGRILLMSTMLTVSIVFIYFPLVGQIERILANSSLATPTAQLARRLERIGSDYFQPGTIDQVNRERVVSLELQEGLFEPIDAAITNGFSVMRDNVDLYLDWYYSLPGEWTRLTQLLAGSIDDHLMEKLSESLGENDPFKAFEDEINRAMATESALRNDFELRAADILRSRQVSVSEGDQVEVIREIDRKSLLSLPEHEGLLTFEQRVGTTVATGGISGMVAAVATRQILLRAGSSGVIRSAALALTRLAVIRAGSTGSGGTIGAFGGGLIGSVVPGVGTAAGAVVGGVIGGLVMGVGAEYLIIRLEELWSREDHRQEIIGVIDEAEIAFRQQIGLGQLESGEDI